MVSGSTSTAIRRPPRLSDTVSAAPIAPIMVKAGVPAASVAATRASGFGTIASIRPKSGERTMRGARSSFVLAGEGRSPGVRERAMPERR